LTGGRVDLHRGTVNLSLLMSMLTCGVALSGSVGASVTYNVY